MRRARGISPASACGWGRLRHSSRGAAAPGAGASPRPLRASAVTLWVLAFLFFLGVLGQALVAYYAVWYWGLIPCPILLSIAG